MDVKAIAELLANEHKAEDREIETVFWHPARDEVRLVEVSGSVPSTGSVLPFRYAADNAGGIPYRSLVILLGTDDWRRVKNKELALPPEFTELELQKIA